MKLNMKKMIYCNSVHFWGSEQTKKKKVSNPREEILTKIVANFWSYKWFITFHFWRKCFPFPEMKYDFTWTTVCQNSLWLTLTSQLMNCVVQKGWHSLQLKRLQMFHSCTGTLRFFFCRPNPQLQLKTKHSWISVAFCTLCFSIDFRV